MPVRKISEVKKFTLPGIVHQTLAGPEQGVKSFEVWLETVSPGAGTPVHRHKCEEFFVVLRGSGLLTIEDRNYPFGPDTTLIVPPDTTHQVINNGSEDLYFLVVLGMAPAQATTPEGQPIPLPWQQS
ncbi:MAG: cupin domain-containing protein [Deltaproteobacteria bacterium]|nr:cupin domain-containing protein [Deltaproteobacteria bacterium]